MKKLLFFFLFISLKMVGQSITLSPLAGSNTKNIVKTTTQSYGFEHTDGTVRLQTYLNNISSSPYFGAWIQTATAHPLVFSTNDGLPQAFINSNGNIILNPNDGKTGNVGIGLAKAATPADKLEVNGNVRISNLAGTGNRHVLADANGTLVAEPSSQSLVLQASNFQPLINSTTLVRYENNLSFTGIGTLVAPINLPLGAKINTIITRVKDNLNTGYILYSLEKMSTTTNTASQLSNGGSTIAAANSSSINYGSTNNLPVTILTNNYYYISISSYDSNGNLISWGSGSTFELNWVEIQYTL